MENLRRQPTRRERGPARPSRISHVSGLGEPDNNKPFTAISDSFSFSDPVDWSTFDAYYI